ncbi:MAG: LptF/LptG family permease [Bacteroidota bacterium]
MLIKKIDKLVLGSYIGLFILTLCVAIFIFLMQFFLIWFDELIGKNLGLLVYLQLFCYFGINVTPLAFPLATLLASLMALGNLGEYLELTALKGAGVSLLRILLPLAVFVVILSGLVFFSNGYLVPKVNEKAYCLLYDLRKKKPSIAIREGVFYNDIPDYSIKVDKKLPDQKTLQGIIIYDHTKDRGNVAVTMAESGQLYIIHGGQYLVMELFNGCSYLEEPPKVDPTKCKQKAIPILYRSSFKTQKVIFDLGSFKLTRSSENLFSFHHTTKNNSQLSTEIADMKTKIKVASQAIIDEFRQHWPLPNDRELGDVCIEPLKKEVLADINNILALKAQAKQLQTYQEDDATTETPATNSTVYQHILPQITQKALDQAKDFRSKLATQVNRIEAEQKDLREYEIEKHKRLASAIGCIIMFLIGAPLGALIRRGGLGVPLLVSTIFILLHYIADMFGVRWAKIGILDSLSGSWAPNLILLPFGLFFLRQAQKDTRLLEGDAYTILLERFKNVIRRRSR